MRDDAFVTSGELKRSHLLYTRDMKGRQRRLARTKSTPLTLADMAFECFVAPDQFAQEA
jgi:hypothetical protein